MAEEAQMSEEEVQRSLVEQGRSMAQAARESAERARRYLIEGRPREAIDSLRQAVSLAPRNADYALQQADFWQASGRLAEAVEGYRRALDLGADRNRAGRNLELSLELSRVQGQEPELKSPVVERLTEALHAQQRELEVILLDAAVQRGLAGAAESGPDEEGGLERDLREYLSQPGWHADRISVRPDGATRVDLSGLEIGRLAGLRGHGVTELDLSGTNVRQLDETRGLGLRRLNLRGTKVTDLRPLAGQPLEELVCGEEVTDLGPLRGLPLKALDVSGSQVSDLSPVEGMALEEVRLSGSAVESLEPLRGMPLKRLYVNATGVTDFGVIGSLQNLEVLDLPAQAEEVDFAALPDLREIFYRQIRPEAPMSVAELQAIRMLRSKLWERHGPVLAQLRLPDMGRHRFVVRDDSGSFDLDLRGTEISDLRALRTMPVHRLYLDTSGAPLDLTPLADHPSLRHLLLVGARVPALGRMAGHRQLESIAFSPDVADVALLAGHPSLRRIGYELDERELGPATSAEEFFGSPEAADDLTARAGGAPVAVFDFDNAADGVQGWKVWDGGNPPPRAFWMADPVASGGRGGGHLTFYEREGNGRPAYFVASPLLARSQRASLYGGLLEFRLRVSEEEPDESLGRVQVVLQAGGRRLFHTSPYRVRTQWRTVLVPLETSALWNIDRPNGLMATEKVLREVLGRLDEILIKAEYTTGVPNERTDLDGVRLWDANAAAVRGEERRRTAR
jgi:hypothetical protein